MTMTPAACTQARQMPKLFDSWAAAAFTIELVVWQHFRFKDDGGDDAAARTRRGL